MNKIQSTSANMVGVGHLTEKIFYKDIQDNTCQHFWECKKCHAKQWEDVEDLLAEWFD